jgi:hypothetical protein
VDKQPIAAVEASSGLRPVAYSGNSIDHMAIEIPSPYSCLKHEGWELQRQWFTSTVFTVAHDEASLRTCQTVLSEHALSHPFLMHGMVALSALHLASQSSRNERAAYIRMAIEHQNHGLSIFRPLVANINSENYVAMIGFSSIIAMLPSGLLRPLQSKRSLSSIYDLCETFFLSKGWARVFQVAMKRSGRGEIGQEHPRTICSPKGVDVFECSSRALDRLRKLNRESGLVDSKFNTEVYACAIDSLGSIFGQLFHSKSEYHLCYQWAIEIPERYIYLVKLQDPFALAILAHYCVVLHWFDHLWWLHGWGKNTLRVIWQHIDIAWRSSLSWPIQVIGLTEIDDV